MLPYSKLKNLKCNITLKQSDNVEKTWGGIKHNRTPKAKAKASPNSKAYTQKLKQIKTSLVKTFNIFVKIVPNLASNIPKQKIYYISI